jgi:CubicO group peptidase (beta-lactamase class C family)
MSQDSPDWRDDVDAFVTDWLSDERIPGAALGVVDCTDGTVRHAKGYGARNLASNVPATPKTVYGVAPVTKSVTALAVLQLVERTRLDLDDPITDYLDRYGDLAEPLTVHELLCHASGMPSDGASVVLIARGMGAAPAEVPLSSDRDLDRHVASALADRDPERRFHYYNTGYTTLGALVETLDGRAFSEYVTAEILEPLGMDRSVVAPDNLSGFENAMTPYRTEDGDRVECDFPVKGVGAAGGLVTSVLDLADYLAAGFNPDPDLVDPDLLARAHETHATRQQYLDGTEQGYGYGWMRRPFLGDTLVEHGGSLGVSTAYVGYLADAGVGVALACNDAPKTHPQFVDPAVLALVQGHKPTATRFYALRERADRVAGTYESHRGIATATVEADGACIEVEFDTDLGGETLTAFPADADPDDGSYYTVAASGARVPVEFERTHAGRLDIFYQRWRLRGQT